VPLPRIDASMLNCLYAKLLADASNPTGGGHIDVTAFHYGPSDKTLRM
jgi:hypothetical protein